MRIALVLMAVLALIAASAGAAGAQSSGWSGYYVGTSASWTGGRSGEIDASIDPFRDGRFDYIRNDGRPPRASTFDRERTMDGTGGVEASAGRLLNTGGGWVWGLEARIGKAALDERFSIGPVDADPLAFGPGGEISYVFGTEDRLTADLDLGAQVSLRARMGYPLGDRVLVSAFAGPSILAADLAVRQDSVIQYGAIRIAPFFPDWPDGPGRPYTVLYDVDQSLSGRESETLIGGTVGAAIDVKLTDRWLVHAEGGLSGYPAIEARTSAYGGAGSRFSYRPRLYSISLGLAYRF
jgi:hypothetical protein